MFSAGSSPEARHTGRIVRDGTWIPRRRFGEIIDPAVRLPGSGGQPEPAAAQPDADGARAVRRRGGAAPDARRWSPAARIRAGSGRPNRGSTCCRSGWSRPSAPGRRSGRRRCGRSGWARALRVRDRGRGVGAVPEREGDLLGPGHQAARAQPGRPSAVRVLPPGWPAGHRRLEVQLSGHRRQPGLRGLLGCRDDRVVGRLGVPPQPVRFLHRGAVGVVFRNNVYRHNVCHGLDRHTDSTGLVVVGTRPTRTTRRGSSSARTSPAASSRHAERDHLRRQARRPGGSGGSGVDHRDHHPDQRQGHRCAGGRRSATGAGSPSPTSPPASRWSAPAHSPGRRPTRRAPTVVRGR